MSAQERSRSVLSRVLATPAPTAPKRRGARPANAGAHPPNVAHQRGQQQAPCPSQDGPCLPAPAGPITERLLHALSAGRGSRLEAVIEQEAVLGDDDFQLALYVLYELHYRGFAGVSDRWEWDPQVLAFRRTLEDRFEAELAAAVPRPPVVAPEELDLALRFVLEADDDPSLSRYIETRASLGEFVELVIHRSAYQLKEADPHSWAIPRLGGAPKAALIRIQSDEYGDGSLERMHAELFRQTMVALELDDAYGAYLARLPGVTLATVNLMSLFGLHRRWRGAIVGHLAGFEMTSSIPNGRYSRGLDRLGRPQAKPFYDEHVLADAVHENLAAVDLAGGLGRQDPGLIGDILFGAACLVELDRRATRHMLAAWKRGESSLR